jgi:hypothetical protein
MSSRWHWVLCHLLERGGLKRIVGRFIAVVLIVASPRSQEQRERRCLRVDHALFEEFS